MAEYYWSIWQRLTVFGCACEPPEVNIRGPTPYVVTKISQRMLAHTIYRPVEDPRHLQTLPNASIYIAECYWMLWYAYVCLEWPSGYVWQLGCDHIRLWEGLIL